MMRSSGFVADAAAGAGRLQSATGVPMKGVMELANCPYDGTEISAEHYSGGSVLLRCEHCGAAWEQHNAWVRRVSEPDRARLQAPVAPRTPEPAD